MSPVGECREVARSQELGRVYGARCDPRSLIPQTPSNSSNVPSKYSDVTGTWAAMQYPM